MTVSPLASRVIAVALALLLGPLSARAQQPLQAQDAHEGAAPEGHEVFAQRAAGTNEPIARSQPDPSIPAGMIVVQVIDQHRQPVAGANVRVGIIRGMDTSRDATTITTDQYGMASLEGQDTGGGAAYRVSLTYQNAVYGAAPFRLEPDRGQLVLLRRLEATTSQNALLQTIGMTTLEFREGRVRVTQQARLANLGDKTITLGAEGIPFELPPGASAFHPQESMEDQRLIPSEGGFVLRGSVPPGSTVIGWQFDLPRDGDAISFEQRVPLHTYQYRVITEAGESMRLEVGGFPRAQMVELEGRTYLHTQATWGPEDQGFTELRLTVRGIPTPSHWRWVAVGGAIIFLLMGLLLFMRPGDDTALMARAHEAKREELLEEARRLHAARAEEEIGPQYFERKMADLERALAQLLQRKG